ncbi:MAG TPA: YraN family protein [Rhodocyclaceae bacterium]|nr:YraN family protein [Rhodocyclaceae bacterium]
MKTAPKDTTSGAAAETLAADWLAQRGLRVIERNFRVRGGEIDLICRDGRTLVFVEVRLRRNRDFGSAADSITLKKRQRLLLAAQHYLLQHPGFDARFDCVLLDALNAEAIEWIKNAFAADD